MTKWVKVDERLPNVHADKFRVKLNGGDEVSAYFYRDSMAWIAWYGLKTSYWWNSKSHEPIFDVIEWMEK